ncbi:hypothetical protein [Trichlorobacter lovleyi]|uniref:Uncharacterized protein n=1 Tax=Trichlorobacter lovleyi (strain ATCC BAA-1151 / DSM 17278 / SZ) TaxID=398767 RepID=B3EBS9_TRIL1|nr:hypothetical protein [Trichlorobacter lovleyi]ACD97361.1 conserved hypothetical protein [Trichlorobacter lovleyi SZ]
MNKNSQFWFRAKTIGIGWGKPVTWQGWFVLLIYFLLIGISAFALKDSSLFIPMFVICVMLFSGTLIFVCYKKGEK